MDERILKDQAIVLRWYPVTDTSRVVVWFTRHAGKVSTLIKGSQRPKSWVLGQYDLFYTCELLFYALAREELHHFKECSPLKRRTGLRTNWRGCAAASHITDLLQRVTPPRAVHENLFDLTAATLDLYARGETAVLPLFWYELHLLRELGLAPDLGEDDPAKPVFAYEEGRILPAAQRHQGQSRPVTPGALALMRKLLREDRPDALARLRALPEQIHEITDHLEHFAAWHLDHAPASRRLALEIMLR
ncbi:MAG: DNA repair protein RecO [Verrucomicrobia bacterium]|nr:DNA repair protein RecO [Verrucomicrobiota bacterium]MCH8529096.1 DNA repair protein RecO [Kiritimatiellia bacterium]